MQQRPVVLEQFRGKMRAITPELQSPCLYDDGIFLSLGAIIDRARANRLYRPITVCQF